MPLAILVGLRLNDSCLATVSAPFAAHPFPVRRNPPVPPAGLEPAVNASTSGRCRRRWATGVAVQNQSGKRESNPPREAHETLLEPLQSIPQSGRQESNLPRTAYQAVASPLSPRPEEAPCTGIEPVFPGRQPGRCTPASSQGNKSVRRESHPPIRRGRSVPGLLGHGHNKQGRKESNPLGQGWSLTALPGARPCFSAEGTGLEPARAFASPAFQAGAIVPVGSPFRIRLSRQGSNLHPSG